MRRYLVGDIARAKRSATSSCRSMILSVLLMRGLKQLNRTLEDRDTYFYELPRGTAKVIDVDNVRRAIFHVDFGHAAREACRLRLDHLALMLFLLPFVALIASCERRDAQCIMGVLLANFIPTAHLKRLPYTPGE